MNEASRRLLPPISALNTFEVAARLNSFSLAGQKVGLTQSAVSRQIAQLEEWLDTSLFKRTGRRISITPAGREYAEQIAPALDQIRRATARIHRRKNTGELHLATLPSFGMRWLAPRLPRLTDGHPDIFVNLASRMTAYEDEPGMFDAMIHFGMPDLPDMTHDFLFSEQAIPVCSPTFMKERNIKEPEDFLKIPLLVQSTRPKAWQSWFSQAGIARTYVETGPVYEHFLMLAQAAAAGAGVALIPSFLIEPELLSGALICPFDITASSDEAYYLAYPPSSLINTSFQHFRDWIISEAKAEKKSV